MLAADSVPSSTVVGALLHEWCSCQAKQALQEHGQPLSAAEYCSGVQQHGSRSAVICVDCDAVWFDCGITHTCIGLRGQATLCKRLAKSWYSVLATKYGSRSGDTVMAKAYGTA